MQALCSHCCVQGVRKGVLMTCVDCCAPSDASLFNTTANQHHLRVTHRSKPRRHKQQRQQQASTPPPFSVALISWQARQRSKPLPPVYSLSQSSSKKCSAQPQVLTGFPGCFRIGSSPRVEERCVTLALLSCPASLATCSRYRGPKFCQARTHILGD